MGAITIRDEISGKPREIKNPLLPEHIKVNCLIWFDGFTSVGSWSCPAIVIKVDRKKRRFRIRSFDDMKELAQWYAFDADDDTSSGRETMRLSNAQEVKRYLAGRKSWLDSRVSSTRSAYLEAQSDSTYFEEQRAKLVL